MESLIKIFIAAGSCRFSVVIFIQASIQEASSNVKVNFLSSAGGGSVVLQLVKKIILAKKRFPKIFILSPVENFRGRRFGETPKMYQ